jgi:protein required for attachment to host cells
MHSDGAGSPNDGAHHQQKKADGGLRAQMDASLRSKDDNIDEMERQGKISKSTARQMHQKVDKLRQEERSMAAQNGGQLTQQNVSQLGHEMAMIVPPGMVGSTRQTGPTL